MKDSKGVRWMPWAAAIEAGLVALVLNPAWNQVFIDEHIIAPNGRMMIRSTLLLARMCSLPAKRVST